MKMKIFYSILLFTIILTIATILLYSVFLSKPFLNLLVARVKTRTYDDGYPVIVGSSIESEFQLLQIVNCSNVRRPREQEIIYNNRHWQEVDGAGVYLYSSHYDTRFTYAQNRYDYVRTIGMARGASLLDGTVTVYCYLWYRGGPIVIPVTVSEIWLPQWNHFTKPDTYHSYLFSCPIPLDISHSKVYPDFVSISSCNCCNATTLLEVQKNYLIQSQLKDEFAVCVKGMNYNQDISVQLIEWIEMNVILGANKIFIYVFSVHYNITKVLNYYSDKNIVEVIPLTLPGEQPNDPNRRTLYMKYDVWQKRRNEIIPYNDCLYRNMYKYNFVIPMDIDEIIIPVRDSSWVTMFSKYLTAYPQHLTRYASFSAQNAYFLEEFNVSTPQLVPTDVPYDSTLLRWRVRSANFSIVGHSVKSFVSTKNTLTIFNHYALKPLYATLKISTMLPTSLVQMNHYKPKCPRDMHSQCKSNFLAFTQKDDIILRYKDQLIKRVQYVTRKLKLL